MKVGLGLGSNVGDRLQHLQQARRYLLSLSPEQWHLQSPLYETRPVDCPAGSGPFYNAVLEIEFSGAPRTLLRKIQAYETAHGRDRDRAAGVNAPRTIDIDILYFGGQELLSKDLVIPHPRMDRGTAICAGSPRDDPSRQDYQGYRADGPPVIARVASVGGRG